MTISFRNAFVFVQALVLAGPTGFGQQLQPDRSRTSASVLSSTEINARFSDSVKKAYKLNLPITLVFQYADPSGKYFCILMESGDSIGLTKNKTDTFSRTLKAVNLHAQGNGFIKVWELNDHILRNQGEYAIWFWKRYFSFEDYDGDGLIDPFLVYGTWGEAGYEDGRIKFIIYLKGKKFAMRHQSNSLDDGRSTEFDEGYDALPKKLRTAIDSTIAHIQKDDHGYFYPLP